MLLTEHIARCEAEGIDFNSYWFKSTLGRLQEVFFQVSSVCVYLHLVYLRLLGVHVKKVYMQNYFKRKYAFWRNLRSKWSR